MCNATQPPARATVIVSCDGCGEVTECYAWRTSPEAPAYMTLCSECDEHAKDDEYDDVE